MKLKYDVALSFAEEDRNIALCIYLALKLLKPALKVYYYPKEGGATAGQELMKVLPEIYKNGCESIIMIVSKDYINPNKKYVPNELKALITRHKEQKSGKPFLVPLLVDETNLKQVDPYFTDSIGWHDWRHDPEGVVEVVAQMLGLKSEKTKDVISKYFYSYSIKAKNIKHSIVTQGSNNNISSK